MADELQPEEQTENVEVTEQEIYDSIGTDNEEAPEAPAPELAPEPEPTPEPEQTHQVPISALLDEREKRQEAARQLQEMQQQMQQREAWEAEQQRIEQEQAQAPDVFENPEYYQQTIPQLQNTVHQLQNQLQQAQRVAYFQQAKSNGDVGLKFARMQDPDTFDKAWEMLEKKTMQDGDPSWRQHLLNTAMQGGDPGTELINLYKHTSNQERVGDDPDAFFEKTLEEKLGDEEFINKLAERLQGQPATPVAGKSEVRLPPSINKAGGAGTAPIRGVTDAEIWAEMKD